MGIKSSDLPLALREKLGIEKPARNKYHVAPKDTRTADGITFDSKAEMHEYRRLKLQVEQGLVKYFLRQTVFHLPGGVQYRCDFTVFYPDGRVEYRDVKGMRTREYITKKKLVEALYPVKIIEVD